MREVPGMKLFQAMGIFLLYYFFPWMSKILNIMSTIGIIEYDYFNPTLDALLPMMVHQKILLQYHFIYWLHLLFSRIKAKMKTVRQIMIEGEDVEIGSDSDVSDTSQIST